MKPLSILIGIILGIAGVLAGLYVFFVWGIIEPITDICKAIDAHQVTASLIGWNVVKFLVRDVFAAIVFVIGLFVGGVFIKIGTE